MPTVVCKLLSSDKDLDLICHMVVLHPECRCSSSFCKSLEGFFKPLLKHCHFWACVSGVEGITPGGIRVTFSDWEEVNLCALFCIIYMYSFHSTIPVGMGELRIRGFDHPPYCPKCVSHSEEWLVMSQEEGSSAMGRNMMVFIPVCLQLVKEDPLLQLLSGS